MNSIEIADVAKEDIIAAYEAIAIDRPEAANRLARRIDEVLEKLALYPELGESLRRAGQNLRMFVVSPYVIVYRYEKECVRVKRVLHTARQWEDLL